MIACPRLLACCCVQRVCAVRMWHCGVECYGYDGGVVVCVCVCGRLTKPLLQDFKFKIEV